MWSTVKPTFVHIYLLYRAALVLSLLHTQFLLICYNSRISSSCPAWRGGRGGTGPSLPPPALSWRAPMVGSLHPFHFPPSPHYTWDPNIHVYQQSRPIKDFQRVYQLLNNPFNIKTSLQYTKINYTANQKWLVLLVFVKEISFAIFLSFCLPY